MNCRAQTHGAITRQFRAQRLEWNVEIPAHLCLPALTYFRSPDLNEKLTAQAWPRRERVTRAAERGMPASPLAVRGGFAGYPMRHNVFAPVTQAHRGGSRTAVDLIPLLHARPLHYPSSQRACSMAAGDNSVEWSMTSTSFACLFRAACVALLAPIPALSNPLVVREVKHDFSGPLRGSLLSAARRRVEPPAVGPGRVVGR